MDKTVDLAEDLSHHIQCKIKPTMALLRMTFNLSSESVMKFFFLFKCCKQETEKVPFLTDSKIHRESERSRIPKRIDGDQCQAL